MPNLSCVIRSLRCVSKIWLVNLEIVSIPGKWVSICAETYLLGRGENNWSHPQLRPRQANAFSRVWKRIYYVGEGVPRGTIASVPSKRIFARVKIRLLGAICNLASGKSAFTCRKVAFFRVRRRRRRRNILHEDVQTVKLGLRIESLGFRSHKKREFSRKIENSQNLSILRH